MRQEILPDALKTLLPSYTTKTCNYCSFTVRSLYYLLDVVVSLRHREYSTKVLTSEDDSL